MVQSWVETAKTAVQLMERSVWWAIARLATSFTQFAFLFPKGETLMLKVNLLTSVAYFLAGLFGKSEGVNWN